MMIEKPIILASQSPRRQELIRLFCKRVETYPSYAEEMIPEKLIPFPSQASIHLAKLKAMDIAQKHPGRVVIGADTVVCVDGQILGKPKDKADAYRMLMLLSGKKHFVYTGVCILHDGIEDSFCDSTAVHFYPLNEQDIHAYIASGEPFDKAGGYGIQGKGALLVRKIDGDYYNVMGFPVGLVYRHLLQIST